MKMIICTLTLLFGLNAFGTIEHNENDRSKATMAETTKNRSCFETLKVQGCGDPGDDPQQFRSCMSNVYPSLPKTCQALMTKLYGP